MSIVHDHLRNLLRLTRQANHELGEERDRMRQRVDAQLGWQRWWMDSERKDRLPSPRLEAHMQLLENNVIESRIVLVTRERSGSNMFNPVSFEQAGTWQALARATDCLEAIEEGGDDATLLAAMGRATEGCALLQELNELQQVLRVPGYFIFEGHVFIAAQGPQAGLQSLRVRPQLRVHAGEEQELASSDVDALTQEQVLAQLAREERQAEQMRKERDELEAMTRHAGISVGQPHEFVFAENDDLPAPRVQARIVVAEDYRRETEVVLVLPRGLLRQHVVLNYGTSHGPQGDLAGLPTSGTLTAREAMELPSVVNDVCFQVETLGVPGFMVVDEERRYRVQALRPLVLQAVGGQVSGDQA